MKMIAITLLATLLSTAASATGTPLKECFQLNSYSASEPHKICFFSTQDKVITTKYAEIYALDGYLLEKTKLTSTSTIMNLGHGVYWNLVLSLGQGKAYSIRATRNSGSSLTFNFITDLKTGRVLKEFKPNPNAGQRRNGCNGQGRCI